MGKMQRNPAQYWLDRAADSHAVAVILLIVFAALCFAPGFMTMPPMDRDEPRFAQATKQMLETGDFVDIRFQDDSRLKKPIGIYWLQSAAVAAGEALGVPEARTTIWLYRIPSLAGAIAAVLLTYWAAIPLGGRRAAFLAGAMMAGSILLGVEARLGKTDAVLAATVVAMMGALARLFMATRPDSSEADRAAAGGIALPALFWTATAASILDKGPIGPMVAGLAMIAVSALSRDWRWLKALRWPAGIAWMVLLIAPWFVAIMVHTGGDFLKQSVGNDMLSKVAGAKESHGAWPGTYLALAFVTFWPAAPLAALASPFVWRARREPAILFLLAWLIPSWIVFEAVPTKLPHYVLPLYPAIAILAAAALACGEIAVRGWNRAIALLLPLVAIVAGVAAIGAVWHFEQEVAWAFAPFALVALGAAGLAARQIWQAKPLEGLALGLAAALCLYWGVYQFGMPALPTLWPSPRIAAAAKALTCPDPQFASAAFNEPSLIFLVGTNLAIVNGPAAADFLTQGGCRMVFVESRNEGAFHNRLTTLGKDAALYTRVDGININGGHRVDIGIYRPAP